MEKLKRERRNGPIEETLEEREEKRLKKSMKLLGKGNSGKCVRIINSSGVGIMSDPRVKQQMVDKHPPREAEIQQFVFKKSPLSNLRGLRDALLGLRSKLGSSPGSGGCRVEYLITLAEVLETDKMQSLEDYCSRYLRGELQPWAYSSSFLFRIRISRNRVEAGFAAMVLAAFLFNLQDSGKGKSITRKLLIEQYTICIVPCPGVVTPAVCHSGPGYPGH